MFERFTNPIWYKTAKLDVNRQRLVAMVITSYDFCRQSVESELISKIDQFLRTNDYLPAVTNKGLTADVRTQLVDEVLFAVLRCSPPPVHHANSKVPSRLLQNLPDLLGMFVLADINQRLHRSAPDTLDQTEYSKDPDEARTQVLIKCMTLLGISSPHFVTRLNAAGFAVAWSELVAYMLAGMLKGFLRTPDDVTFLRARKVAAVIPAHRAGLLEYFIEHLGELKFDQAAAAGGKG